MALSPYGDRRSRARWPVERDPVFGCELWQGEVHKGMPVMQVRGRSRGAHRLAYELEHGALPTGVELDHLCRRPTCINPAHLERVTRSENEKRKSFRYRLRTMTRCSTGHDLQRYGALTPEGGRICRVCSGLTQLPT